MEYLKKIGTFIKNKYSDFHKMITEEHNKRYILTYIFLSLSLNLVIEMLGRKSPIKGIYHLISSPYVFLINTMIILMTLSITLLMRKRIFFMALISFLWLTVGVANCILLNFRVTPFSYTDLMLIESALDILNKYLNIFGVILIVMLFIAAIIGLIVIFIKVPKIDHKIRYIRNSIMMAAIVISTFFAINLAIGAGLLAVNFGNLADAYLDYGFVYCFSNSCVNRGISKPKNYSQKTVDEVIDKIDENQSIPDGKKPFTPNILFVQLESFFDINRANNIVINKDPIPIFNSLREKGTSGFVSVPVIGAGTVNTEFEAFTGMNLDDFGPGEYPFKTRLLETTCESICYDLKNNGYSTHVIHDNTGTFYGRNEVLPNLGVDTFTSIEFMNGYELTPLEWAKDSCLTDEIMDTFAFTKDQQDFIYTITVQSHGSYPTTGEYPTDYVVKAAEGYEDEINEGQLNAMAYYCQQIHEVDEFIGELIERLSAFDEETILVMYGDHLPSLGFTDEDFEGCDVFDTEYIIWANYNLGSQNIYYSSEDLELYQLGSKILKGLKITDGAINEYHQTCKDSEEYLNGLQTLEYDILYGDMLAYGGVNPYERTDMRMGIRDIYISGIVKADDGYVDIQGVNFTKYSVVYKEGEVMQTEFIDTETLRVYDPDIEMLDSFTVSQQNSNKHVLFTTKPYLYIGN